MTVILETVRVRHGHAPFWTRHLARLARACGTLGVPMPVLVPPDGDDRVVRFEVARDGVRCSERSVGSLAPVALQQAAVLHPRYPHKVAERAAFEIARTEAQAAGSDDALLMTGDGWVAEATIWAIGWWTPRGLAFPPLQLGLLPSIGRARLGELVTLDRSALLRPEELQERALVAVNAVRGPVAVASLEGVPLPQDARLAGLQAAFWPPAEAPVRS